MNVNFLNPFSKFNYIKNRSSQINSSVYFCANNADGIISGDVCEAQKAQVVASCEIAKQQLLAELVVHIEKITTSETFEKIKQTYNELSDKKSKLIFDDSKFVIPAKSIEVTMYDNHPSWIRVKKDKYSTLTEICCTSNGPSFARIQLNKKYGNKKVVIYYGPNNEIAWLDYGVKSDPKSFIIEETYEVDKNKKLVLSKRNTIVDYDALVDAMEKLPL